jgi:carbamoyl-phosphate synthase large subunit
VTKVPRWAFEKLPGSVERLGTRMQSVGEVMAIGRTFCESVQKALRSLEQGRFGLNADPSESAYDALDEGDLVSKAKEPTPDRIFQLEAALRRGVSAQVLSDATGVDLWFLDQLHRICDGRAHLESLVRRGMAPEDLDRRTWRSLKRLGFSDAQMAYVFTSTRGSPTSDSPTSDSPTRGSHTRSEKDDMSDKGAHVESMVDEGRVRRARLDAGVRATFKTVDTCGAEFAASTPYHYSTYEDEDEVRPGRRPRVVILGSGPNRIGQGIEFDYCCVHASMALREAGFETVMVNCNPETVSTDYDTSDRLYFEPLTVEDVANVIEAETTVGFESHDDPRPPVAGVIVALGGQTPLKLSHSIDERLVLGTPASSIDVAEDRERWNLLCERLGITQPAGGTAAGVSEALAVAHKVGYPVLVRPSYVLGGRAMEIVYDDEHLEEAIGALARSLRREGGVSAERPVLVDRFLEDAVEVDVDALRDRAGESMVAGIMEHVEEAGVHSGDSACALPPQTLTPEVLATIELHTFAIADALGVVGLLNVQYAVKEGTVYVLEANPRASRTVPFVAKATGVPLAKIAARVMTGSTLEELRGEGLVRLPANGKWVSVKEAVLPFSRFPGVDSLLGPEMRSTGEVMGIGTTFGLAFVKSQIAAGTRLEPKGTVFFSLADRDKASGLGAARTFCELGMELVATSGTASYLESNGVPVSTVVGKVGEASGADAVELISSGKVQLVVNTPRGRGPRADGVHIRSAALMHDVPCLTTVAAARAAAAGLVDWRRHGLSVVSLQEAHALEEAL